MNKSQELAVMKLRAKIKTEETMKQHQQAWYGKEPEVIEEVEKEESNASLPGLQ